METFFVGDEVLYQDERYVISEQAKDGPYDFKLLATGPKGAKVIWATTSQLKKLDKYTKAADDTDTY